MSNIDWSIISYDEGWDYIQNKGIKKLLQSLPNPRFTSEDCSMLYTYVICHTLWRTNIFQNIYVFVSGTCRYQSHVSVPHRQTWLFRLTYVTFFKLSSNQLYIYIYIYSVFIYMCPYFIDAWFLCVFVFIGLIIFYFLLFRFESNSLVLVVRLIYYKWQELKNPWSEPQSLLW
jgi:hypothetical protein